MFKLIGIVFFFFGILTIYSCQSSPNKKISSAKYFLNKGIKEIRLNDPEQAKAAFKKVLEDFPNSKERIQSLLLLARTHYGNKEFQEAKFHFQKFIELYPTHREIDRAYFFRAMSDYKMIDLASRDQTFTQEALTNFKELVKRFPKSQFIDTAKLKQKKCEFKLAQNIMEIGRFYYRTGSYQSAINRLKNLISEHPKQKFWDEAVFLLAESYYNEQNFKAASTTYKQLLKQYPRSQFKIQAKTRLLSLRKQTL